MFRPTSVNVFEPLSPEYSLASSIDAEYISYATPKIMWWSFDKTDTMSNMTELDKIYGESHVGKDVFYEPNIVEAHLEINPIMMELMRLGVEQIEEVILFANTDQFYIKNASRDPKSGDIFRVSYIVNEDKYRNVFYTVGSVIPVDLFNFKYLNWRILGQQTNLSNASQQIKDYMNSL
jgi:hypothetical protein